jgi:hypothetical protein
MTEFVTTIEDVLASTQVLEDVMNKADSYTPEEAVAFRVAVEEVGKAVRMTLDLLNQELVRTLDGQPAVERDGIRYFIGAKTVKEVTDHAAIARDVTRVALEVVAEMDDVADHDDQMKAAAQAAVTIMSDLYVSPSTDAKKLQLDKYGIERHIEKQRGEKVVKTVPVNRVEP